MSDRGVVRGTRRRRSISESGHPRVNSTILDSDLVFDKHDLVNIRNNVTQRSPANSNQEHIMSSKVKILREKISAWQSIIKYELSTIDSIKTDHNQLKGEIHSLYQESIYAHASEKLSYDIIGLISLIARVKDAALRLIRNDKGVDGNCLRN